MSWVPLTGAENVRDLGGLPTGSTTTREGVLLRGDSLERLTEADADELVGRRGLARVIDLRSGSERAERGRGVLQHRPVRYDALDVIGDADLARRHDVREQEFAAGTDPSVFTSNGYLEMLDLGAAAFVTSFRRLIEPGGTPALVHCSLGKDRTGVLVAMLLEVAGVERGAIVADYVASNATIGAIKERWESSAAFRNAMLKIPAFIFEAKESTMELFLDGLRDHWGGAEGYFAAQGVPSENFGTWRELFLEPAPGGIMGSRSTDPGGVSDP